MATTQATRWHGIGAVPPASNGNPCAGAGSFRLFYERDGEYCYRSASWGEHGTGVHAFRCYGDASGCDEWGIDNGKTYPSAEFE